MIAVIQRCSEAAVKVAGEVTGSIGTGLVVLLGIFEGDERADADFLAKKIVELRIFNDEQGKMNLSLGDVGGAVLSISQFTLCGDWRKGRRPSFIRAAPPEKGKELYEYFNGRIRELGFSCETGVFGAMMEVFLVNDGPVTFVLDSKLK